MSHGIGTLPLVHTSLHSLCDLSTVRVSNRKVQRDELLPSLVNHFLGVSILSVSRAEHPIGSMLRM